MGYNQYRWWTNIDPIKKIGKLQTDIKKGYYNESPMWKESLTYKNFIEQDRNDASYHSNKLKRVRYHTLLEKAHQEDEKKLLEFREDLRKLFGIDLWEKMLEQPAMSPSQVYKFYEKNA